MIMNGPLIENPKALYITFDNKKVGELEAAPVFKLKPKGNYLFIKGNSADPNADFVFSGQMDVVGKALKSGAIKDVGQTYTDNWDPANAQKETEQFLTKNNNKVDAVLSENDGMAGGVVAALTAQGLAGQVPVSGQDFRILDPRVRQNDRVEQAGFAELLISGLAFQLTVRLACRRVACR